MRVFTAIIALIFLTTLNVGCATLSNHNDLNISVDKQDCEPENSGEYPKTPEKVIQPKPKVPHLWKWADTVKKR